MRRLCVFAGARPGGNRAFLQAASELGRLLALRGVGLVYGGGRVGLMGALADAALAHGAEVIGVIPRELMKSEVAHDRLTQLRVVETMHDRKATMAQLADGFLALPGGLGTLEELFEVMTWSQLRIHVKPCGLLNVAGYYDPMLQQLRHAEEEAFIGSEAAHILVVAEEPASLLDEVLSSVPAARIAHGAAAPVRRA